MNDELKKEILSLLESPELWEYLMAPPEKLHCAQYAEIICGAPISLYRKWELLLRLKVEASEKEMNDVVGMLSALDTAQKSRKMQNFPASSSSWSSWDVTRKSAAWTRRSGRSPCGVRRRRGSPSAPIVPNTTITGQRSSALFIMRFNTG